MKTSFTTVSPVRLTVAVLGAASACLFAPEISHAAVAFGDIGRNIAENAKGVATGITLGGYCAGAGMGVWGCVDMYDASRCFLPFSFVCCAT